MANAATMRLVYENAKALFRAAGVDVERAYLTQSKIRSERQLNTTTNNYQFSFLQQDGVPSSPTEVKLNQAYAALIYELGFFIAEPSSATDNSYGLFTFPDPIVFNATNEAGALNQLYNGSIQLKINGQDILVNYPMEQFRVVPNRQASVAATTPPPNAVSTEFHGDQVFHPIEPNIVLYGNWKFDFSLVLPGALAAVGANTKAIFIAKILLAQNAVLIGTGK